MRSICLPAILAYVWAAAIAAGQTTPPGVDVPDWAREEVLRRGDKVEHVQGGFEHGHGQEPPDLWGAPADDSGKWHLVVFTTRGCSACAALYDDLAKSAELRAFVNLEDHKASWAACNIYRSEDGSQTWRMRLYQRHLAEAFPGVQWQYPMVIVQPPRKGRWGDPRTIIGVRGGYDGDEAKLAGWLRATIEGYCKRLLERVPPASAPPVPEDRGGGTIKQAAVPAGEPIIGGAPAVGGHGQAPFPVPPRLDPLADGGGSVPSPIEFPPARRGASVQELQTSIPGVDAEFILQQVTAKATLQEALQAWQIRLLQKQAETAKAEAAKAEAAKVEAAKAEAAKVEATKPAAPSAAEPVSWPTILLGALVILSTIRTIRQQMGVPTIVPDDWWTRGVELIQGLLTKQQQQKGQAPSGGSSGG